MFFQESEQDAEEGLLARAKRGILGNFELINKIVEKFVSLTFIVNCGYAWRALKGY